MDSTKCKATTASRAAVRSNDTIKTRAANLTSSYGDHSDTNNGSDQITRTQAIAAATTKTEYAMTTAVLAATS